MIKVFVVFVEKVPLKRDEIFSVNIESIALKDYPFHIHPEYELIVIQNISGKRFVGNSIATYTDHDMAFLAPNLPHKWKFESYKSNSRFLVLKFKETLLRNELFDSAGCEHFQNFLNKVSRGIHFTNNKDIEYCADELERISRKTGYNSILSVLNLINYLFETKEKATLSGRAYSLTVAQEKLDKVDKIYNYILDNFTGNINIEEIAEQNNLSKSGFCNYFKRHTGLNYSEFINELRISQACKMLVETSLSITEICFGTGFRNLSYFNRIFREITTFSPREYRKEFLD